VCYYTETFFLFSCAPFYSFVFFLTLEESTHVLETGDNNILKANFFLYIAARHCIRFAMYRHAERERDRASSIAVSHPKQNPPHTRFYYFKKEKRKAKIEFLSFFFHT
jgi:hypothetical protein